MNFIQKINIHFKFLPVYLLLLFSILLLNSCQNKTSEKMDQSSADENLPRRMRIHEILERGKLIATTDYNSTDYFIYRGEPMGYQYEKLKMLADYLGVDLEINVALNIEDAFRSLEEGKSDLIAMGLTQTLDRSEKVDFTVPLFQTRQMLVQRKPENWRKMTTWDQIEQGLIRNPIDLAGKTVVVQMGSAYFERMRNLSQEIGMPIIVKEDSVEDVEQLVGAVDKGDIDFTVCDEHLVGFFEKQYPDLDIRTPVSFPQNIAWAVRQGSDSLLLVINEWLKADNNTFASKHLIDKYFNSSRSAFMAKNEALGYNGRKISKYDEIIRNLAGLYDLDWRLVASIVSQESKFDADSRSWSGAFGLMQLMPSTAALLGVDSTASETEQLEAGIKYLKVLDGELPKEIRDPQERIKFVLASYNLGIAHVFDARRLAEKNGKNPNVWTNNVDYYVLNKANPEFYRDSVVRYGSANGKQAYNFVVQVLNRYERYKGSDGN
jgi:membrane-bound lytic murein transglycosylase F